MTRILLICIGALLLTTCCSCRSNKPVEDAAPEKSTQPDTENAEHTQGSEVPHRESDPPPAVGCAQGECGQDGTGGYCEPCKLGDVTYWYSQHWTLCDEAKRECFMPQADCTDGWCRIPAASFMMGQNPDVEVYGSHDYVLHPQVITRSFQIQRTEVTRKQWLEVMQWINEGTRFEACGEDCPINGISVFDALSYANRLSDKNGFEKCYVLQGCTDPKPGEALECESALFAGPNCTGYRLPSVPEWELAAGAGTDTCFPSGKGKGAPDDCWDGNTAADIGWFCANCEVAYEGCSAHPATGACCGIHPVAQKEPNLLGLYDTAGNVWEMTGSLEHEYGPELALDTGYDPEIMDRVARKGGGYGQPPLSLCTTFTAYVKTNSDGGGFGHNGFRLVRTTGL